MADLKQLARRIFHQTIAAIDIPLSMQRKLSCQGSLLHCGDATIDLSSFENICVVAIGKAAHSMVGGLKACLLRDLPFTGIVSAPTAPASPLSALKYFIGGHPIPDGESWKAAEAILEMLAQCGDRTLVFFLLSGGGSALAELPLDRRFSLPDVQQVHRALIGCGAPIDAINTVRKHFSAVKGGRLAGAAARATKITLAVSDVPAGKESALASGPTLPDPSTIEDMREVLRDYSLLDKLPDAFNRWVAEGAVVETPKVGAPAFNHSHFLLLLGMDDLFHPAHGAAEGLGFIACCDNTTDDWPVQRAAEYLLAQLAELQACNPSRRVAIIADGEVSSPVTGDGIGGRNSAFVLACTRAHRRTAYRGSQCGNGRHGREQSGGRSRSRW